MIDAGKMKTISSETIYKGKIFDVRVDAVREGDVEYEREVVVHSGSCVIVPVYPDNTVALVRQYRHAAGKHLLELPAGTLEAGEGALTAAIRELEEEVGVTAGKMEKLCEFWVSPGFLTEKMFVYMATGLIETSQNLEADEVLTVERIPIQNAILMSQEGQIEDAKTIIGLMFASRKIMS
jgi:ADP-ribose pyrophosphatase